MSGIVADLLARRDAAGPWRSALSSSALGGAVALIALTRAARAGRLDLEPAVASGLAWLRTHANDDGGYGDTTDSPSNPSTSALAWAALGMHGDHPAHTAVQRYLDRVLGGHDDATLATALTAAYGDDRTFSVPILAAAAIAGAFGEGAQAWRSVPRLPFELAAVPRGLWSMLGFPVVSYALPALIAIGQAAHFHRPPWNPLLRWLRDGLRAATLAQLRATQPATGGYLEAIPLTAFVAMALIDVGLLDHAVTVDGLAFLQRTQRADGSWPIDVNLDTWVTTLAINALGDALPTDARPALRAWLLDQQHTAPHPFTDAAPGGWAWTDLPGGVPDADDTPGALLALAELDDQSPRLRAAVAAGVRWLVSLQNRDGGIPTFCKGWGRLPFDASTADLTAHTLRAFRAWRPQLDAGLGAQVDAATARATAFLRRTQRADGAWLPLWFGSQRHADQSNPVYGTSRVLRALVADPSSADLVRSGAAWLVGAQQADGAWGADVGVPPTVEETALATEALALVPGCEAAAARGAAWLEAQHAAGAFGAAPIGLYFARLWYSEGLYGLVYGASAVRRVRGRA